MKRQLFYQISLVSLILFLFGQGQGSGCQNNDDNIEDPNENKITINRISPSSINQIGQSFDIYYSYYLKESSSKNVSLKISGLYGTSGSCGAYYVQNWKNVNPTTETRSGVETINTSVFQSPCNQNNRVYTIQLVLKIDEYTTEVSELFTLTVGTPLLSCLEAEVKTFNLEHDLTKFGNTVYNFRKTSEGSDNPALSSYFNPTFQECKVNMSFTGSTEPNLESDNIYFDFNNDRNTMILNIFNYTALYWDNEINTNGYIVSLDKFINVPSGYIENGWGYSIKHSSYASLKAPSFVFIGLMPALLNNEHRVATAAHEIGHKFGIWTHSGHSDDLSTCCIMRDGVSPCGAAAMKFCNTHKCLIYTPNF